MATDVVMPQMGESLAEGTVTKWLKQVGDKIERDEPLFEISTDKVDSVIPAPAGGYLTAIKVPEAGLGISASTLSVEISNRGWSRSTFSPTFTSHRVIVPSAIDSPIWGITTSVAISSPVSPVYLFSGCGSIGVPLSQYPASSRARLTSLSTLGR